LTTFIASLVRSRSLLPRLALAACLLAAPALAAVPEPESESQPPAASASDSARFLPRWLHAHGSVGLGWIASPAFIRERYEVGQAYELGVEARPRSNLRVRVAGEYQVLPAVGRVTYQIVTFEDLEGGQAVDTLSFDWIRAGWFGSGRTELQWRALPETWLIAGAGRGFLRAGHRPYHFRDPGYTVDLAFPGSSGWAWTGMLGARYEFDLFGPRLGAELRWSTLERPQDRLRTWSIRIGWQGR
jgi:hypothetical protein